MSVEKHGSIVSWSVGQHSVVEWRWLTSEGWPLDREVREDMAILAAAMALNKGDSPFPPVRGSGDIVPHTDRVLTKRRLVRCSD